MQRSASSAENPTFIGHDNLTKVNLRANGKRQVVRLVNASDSKMMFAFKSTSKLLNSNIEIFPRKGTIAPRSYANIAVEDLSYNLKSATEICQFNLIYWVSSSPKANKGLVRIDLVGGGAEIIETTKEQSVIWVIVSMIRSTFLFALVVYNIFLIKHSVL